MSLPNGCHNYLCVEAQLFHLFGKRSDSDIVRLADMVYRIVNYQLGVHL